jgi:mannose-6-phosphate isomerase-like protein (cupin superfamily)
VVLVYGISGKSRAQIGNEIVDVTPGTLIYIPPMVIHKFINQDDLDWIGLAVIISPRDAALENIWVKDDYPL